MYLAVKQFLLYFNTTETYLFVLVSFALILLFRSINVSNMYIYYLCRSFLFRNNLLNLYFFPSHSGAKSQTWSIVWIDLKIFTWGLVGAGGFKSVIRFKKFQNCGEICTWKIDRKSSNGCGICYSGIWGVADYDFGIGIWKF